ncbi:hypothetical protein Pint_20670 [Pistacia integerrima]|uniref:Uncharacterized protein n=1 Tax=Pistacia integerrima TaxID=434235 RepID=A0ACC0XF01_9ROSI|nr:hypothetical protein Pint_20670 [Pistacia integerrima]
MQSTQHIVAQAAPVEGDSFNSMFQVQPLDAQTINDSDEKVVDQSHLINIPEEEVKSLITDSVAEEFKSLDDAIVQVNCRQKIQKVPSILRANNNFTKHYEPRMIAIGPYHHNNPNLKNTEMLKLKLASLFIKKYTLNREVLYSKVRRYIEHLRECYEEEATAPFRDDDELAWMFFVDGCALLHYIDFAMTDKEDTMIKEFKEKGIKIEYLVYVKQDLFLLENQLPYGVLKLLISCMSNKMRMEMSIEKFIFGIKDPRKKDKQSELKLLQKEDPIHLLDLLRTGLLQMDVKENQMPRAIVRQLIKKISENITEPLEKVKNLMECIVKPIENCFSCTQVHHSQFFRNVEELKAAGIRLRPSGTGCLKDVTFNLGALRLPSIQVDDSTASMFLNLIAYEMCPDFVNDFGVSSYVAFLDILIDKAQDVKELRDKQILHNLLGSDEDVAKLFNEIGTDLVSNPNIYGDVKSKIQRRYDNKFMTSMAQFIHEYFRSPWSVIAFVAAIIALASTVAQTVYTILGYYK